LLGRVLIIIGILVALNIYVASRIIIHWPLASQHMAIAWLVALAFFILQLAGPFGDRLVFPKLKKEYGAIPIIFAIDWASYLAFGVMSLLVVYGFATDIVGIAWELIVAPVDPVNFDRWFLLTLGVLTFGTVVIGVLLAIVGPIVKEVTIPLKNLPTSFDGFKIVQISDLHVGSIIGRAYTQNVVNIANELRPDLIALTGDFSDGTVEGLGKDLLPIADLEAPYGKFFVPGNHEYFWDLAGWLAQFKKMGVRVLSNEHVIIERYGSAIVLAGVPDYSTTRMRVDQVCDPSKALIGVPPGLTKILLAHQPATYRMAHEADFDLQLSGHTHGGQYFPYTILIRFFQRYYRGLNRHENMWVYVNTGTGYWGPPLRLGAPSEITLITLRSE